MVDGFANISRCQLLEFIALQKNQISKNKRKRRSQKRKSEILEEEEGRKAFCHTLITAKGAFAQALGSRKRTKVYLSKRLYCVSARCHSYSWLVASIAIAGGEIDKLTQGLELFLHPTVCSGSPKGDPKEMDLQCRNISLLSTSHGSTLYLIL